MTKADMLKRLAPMDDDKVLIFVDNSSWANIEDIVERDCHVEITIEKTPVFSEG